MALKDLIKQVNESNISDSEKEVAIEKLREIASPKMRNKVEYNSKSFRIGNAFDWDATGDPDYWSDLNYKMQLAKPKGRPNVY